MRRFTAFTTAAALTAFSTSALAGGLSPEIMEAPVVADEAAPAGSSINPAFIVVGVLVALLIASGSSSDSDGESTGVAALPPSQLPVDPEIAS